MTLHSEISKFLTFPPISEQIGALPTFGRLKLKDERNKNFPLRAKIDSQLESVKIQPKKRKWRARWQGNQGTSSMCTAFSFLHFFEHEPINHPRAYGKFKGSPVPIVDPRILYCEAQNIDPWPGGCGNGQIADAYDGTSVLAMMKVVQERGFISGYVWEYTNVDNIINTILNIGPVIMGTNWYSGMELKPGQANTQQALLQATGRIVGGHAYLLDEVNLTKARKGAEIGVFNSWGDKWGWGGRAFMSLDTLEKLLREDGECIFPMEVP